MKTSKEMAQEYIDEYPKVEKNKDEYLFESYVGNNGNKIRAKKRKYLKYYTDDINLGVLFIDSQEEEFWSKIKNSKNNYVYMWGSSILFDFDENFYYQLCNFDEDIGKTYQNIITEKKAFICKYNNDSKNVEETFESDIIIL